MKKLVHLLLGAFVLLSYGWFNRFPFVYPDTGDYISSGFLNYVPQSRPIFYGLFLRHVSLSESLWIPVFFQAVFVAYCFYLLSKHLFSSKWLLTYWVLIVVTTSLTGVSVLVSTLLPDVFTPIVIISTLALLWFDLKGTDRWLTAILLFLSIPMHNSHLPVVIAMISFTAVVFVVKRKTQRQQLKRLILPVVTVSICLITIFSTNYAFSDKWKMSNGGSVFMVNRLIEIEVLQDFLENNCGEKDYALCAFKDELEWGFLWEANSPLYKLGGWDAVEPEFSELWKDALSHPKYMKQFLVKSAEGTLSQWWMVDIDWVIKQKEGTAPHTAITRFYPDYKIIYESSGQNIGVWDFQNLNDWQKIFMVILSALFFLILALPGKLLNQRLYSICWTLLIGFAANAFVCAAISNALSRYQYRVSFLLVAFVLLIFWDGRSFSFSRIEEMLDSQKDD